MAITERSSKMGHQGVEAKAAAAAIALCIILNGSNSFQLTALRVF